MRITTSPLIYLLAAFTASLGACANSSRAPSSVPETDLTRFVNPWVGTAPADLLPKETEDTSGDTFFGVAVPFGMAGPGPDTGPSGYSYADKRIFGFGFDHLSGTCGFSRPSILPFLGTPELGTGISFDHRNEVSAPEYYSVILDDGIHTELTATRRTGFARIRFPAGKTARLALEHAPGDEFRLVDATHAEGSSSSGSSCKGPERYRVYFAIELDHPVVGSAKKKSHIEWDFGIAKALQVKVGLSFVSSANAQENLRAESPGWDFAQVRERARAAWNEKLGRILVDEPDAAARTVFYTALYRVLSHPNLFSDVNGDYLGADDKVHRGVRDRFSNFWNWDMYRTKIPLLAVVYPNEANDMMQSLVGFGAECGQAIPNAPVHNREADDMGGDPGPSSVAGGYAYGLRGFDVSKALLFARNNVLKGVGCRGHVLRDGLADYDRLGYAVSGLHWPGGGGNIAGSVTLEYYNSDFATSRLALALGDQATAERLAARAANWPKLFDASIGYFRPRDAAGKWLTNFDPFLEDMGFDEGNSAQYSFNAPFALGGLAKLLPRARLQAFFSHVNDGPTSPHMYIGNEPSFAAPWIYHYQGAPDETRKVLDKIRAEAFFSTPGGLPGMDDLGELSAWYVASAIGLYPLVPGVGSFAVTTPAFRTVQIRPETGKNIMLETRGASPAERTIQSLTVNGREWQASFIPWEALQDGASLRFETGAGPSDWGVETGLKWSSPLAQ